LYKNGTISKPTVAFQFTGIEHSDDSIVYFGYNPETGFGSPQPWIGNLTAHDSTDPQDTYWSLNVEATYYNGE
jgi:hypothetical protein